MSVARIQFFGLMSLACLLLAGCGAEPPAADGSSGAGVAAGPAPAADLGTLMANADVKRGQTLFFQCRACHSMNEGGANKVGPNLWDMFDCQAGLAPGFAYSDPMKDSDVIWTPETVDDWLEQPSQFMPGNRMVFVGVRDPQDRANLIAYLQQETGAAK